MPPSKRKDEKHSRTTLYLYESERAHLMAEVVEVGRMLGGPVSVQEYIRAAIRTAKRGQTSKDIRRERMGRR